LFRDQAATREKGNREVSMSRKRLFLIGLAVLVGGWYLFRPERVFIQTKVSEQLPGQGAAGSPQTLLKGRFHSVAHETRGAASVYRLPDGKQVLRFTEFQTSNGPDVHVYLVAAPDANDNETVTRAGFIHLGVLKGTQGDQNYEVAADVDLTRYRAATIWCRRFGVNFGTAPLTAAN
jgi:hypothetical protein